jgi:hypothetical protein
MQRTTWEARYGRVAESVSSILITLGTREYSPPVPPGVCVCVCFIL